MAVYHFLDELSIGSGGILKASDQDDFIWHDAFNFYQKVTIDGGAGIDTVTFGDAMSSYTRDRFTVSTNPDGSVRVHAELKTTYSVAGFPIAMTQYVDTTLINVEQLRFHDATGNFIYVEIGQPTIPPLIAGTGDRDVLSGTNGNDIVDGGAGIDAYVLPGTYSDAQISIGSDGVVRVEGATWGADTLTNVERLVFSDRKLALDVSGNALKAVQFIGVIAPSLQNNLAAKGAVLAYFDEGHSLTEAFQLALQYEWLPLAPVELVKAVYRNVFATTTDPDQATLEALMPYVTQYGSAGFLAAVAELNLNVDLVGLEQSGLQYL